MRAILVCGIGCSGTSAVAGALHAMGCPMGHEAHMGTHPAGFALYEDAEFYGIFQRGNEGAIRRVILRHAREPIFGWKNTLTWKALDWLPEFFDLLNWEMRIVACHRAALESARGREYGRCPPGVTFTREDAEYWMLKALNEYSGALLEVLNYHPVPLYHIQYERLIRDPTVEVQALAAFAFDDLDVTTDLEAGIAQIERRGQ